MGANARLKLLPDGPYIEIDGDSLYLGRDCHLAASIPPLKSKVVSNRHCCIKKEPDGRWTLEDLHSTNGTWLRGDKLSKREVLISGDTVTLGRNGPKFACELPVPVEPNATMVEDEVAAAETMLASPDGSAERPYRVGRTPEVTLRHERTGEEFRAKGYTIVLGRDPVAAQIVIHTEDQKHVSGRHAEIQFRANGAVVVRDLASRNGSWVNQTRVTAEAALHGGDKIVLGAPTTALLVVRLESS